MRLFCFAHAGGGSLAYRGWRHPTDALEVVPVVLPGREARWRDPMPTDMPALVDQVVSEIGDGLFGEYAFFGHSFGAGLAYEVLRATLDRGLTPPRLLAVSGRRAPHRPATRPAVHDASDEVFLAHLVALGGIPDEVRQHPALLETFIPTLRADFAVHETYRPTDGPRLGTPVSAFTGDADPAVSVVDVLAWRDTTKGSFRARVMPGGHFYLRDHSTAILTAIHDDLGGRCT